MEKPIGIKNYGSIPHLSNSKLTQKADKKIEIGQERMLTEKLKNKNGLVVVTEKVDGSNVGVVKKDGKLLGLTRSGYLAKESQYAQHRVFGFFVEKNKDMFEWLPEGYRVVGEWSLLSCGTKYNLIGVSPFLAFDIFNEKNKRLLYKDFKTLTDTNNVPTVGLVHVGGPITTLEAMAKLIPTYFSEETPEGIVYTYESGEKVSFKGKFVKADKQDGKYMKQDILNEGIKSYLVDYYLKEKQKDGNI